MRILQLHCDSIEFTPTKKEIKSAEDIVPESKKLDEVVVAFVAMEQGDDSQTAKKAIGEITASMDKVGCKKLLLYPYAHLSSNLASPSLALSLLKEMESLADGYDVSHAPFGWTKSYNVKVKGHPLAESSKTIVNESVGEIPAHEGHTHDEGHTSDALKSESKIQSFWYIMTPEGEMHEVGKFNFAKHEKLEILSKYESAKKRAVDEPPPHVKLMKKMAIADYEPASDSGNMRFYPNGRLIKSLLERFVNDQVKEYGGLEVETPIMYDSHHPSMESYFNRFPARQYNINTEGKQLFLRFAACFGQFLMANDFQISYRNMPLKLYELTRYSFRREQSGELVGLRRLRAFTMPDCHAFCTDIPQAVEEMTKRFELSRNVLKQVGINESDYEMAIRFTEEFYNEHKSVIHNLVKKLGKPVLVEMWKERFFYFVLKWEFNYVDSLGKASALSTDQIDVENGMRYGIKYFDENNVPHHPIILHNSPSGAIERVIYVLLEKAALDQKEGRKASLPLWLAPTQVRIIPLKEEFLQHCEALADRLTKQDIRVDIDDRNETIGKRIRESETEWIRYSLVIGEKEVNQPNLSVRDRISGNVTEIPFDDFVADIKDQTKEKPFTRLNLSRYMTKRPQIMV
ncbi:threonine--tRNA ligase [Candidatus Nitrosotenuis sp. DW1]|uniref:threonine--tRNA ligase n=1 Tax=Candidatus Nitrosotenuis sp. DW1 TaxID=2259672 RepID=UPI0015CE2B67|nr:threonine--tRNA ligase [Candidatus Nitrosotenuis sp. DW1]QLH09963.1 threonine--tRNA ligase [Candidatus Nitrosotenuis sp. DW1]